MFFVVQIMFNFYINNTMTEWRWVGSKVGWQNGSDPSE